MNISKMRKALYHIEEREAALSWLEDYGVQLTGNDEAQATVTINLVFAGSAPGALQAKELMASYARLELPQIVKSAIACCRNDIEIFRSQVLEELGTGDGGMS